MNHLSNTILLTNDDGIHSPGLAALQEALTPLGRLVIIAPDRDNSAVSHSLTMNRPLKVTPLGSDRYTIDGTPTDCVAVGLKKILHHPPALLVSGINTGPNLGDDISYSGTVSAAIEGTMYGVPSLAISVAGTAPFDFSEAMRVASFLAARTLANSLPPDTLLNVNVPSTSRRCQLRVTRQGRRLWENSIHEALDPRGATHYWIGGGRPLPDPGEDTDVHALASGLVSITPIHLDLTNHAGITYLKNNWRLEEPEAENLP